MHGMPVVPVTLGKPLPRQHELVTVWHGSVNWQRYSDSLSDLCGLHLGWLASAWYLRLEHKRSLSAHGFALFKVRHCHWWPSSPGIRTLGAWC